MKINHIQLKNFRNYQELDFSPTSDVTVFFGKNGQGKTNIIESVFLCSTGKSHRTQKYGEMIKDGEIGFEVKLGTEKEILFKYDNKNGRNVEINEIPIARMGELMGSCCSVLFSPEDLSIIRDGPSFRRRFFDIALSQLKPAYFYNLQKYKKIISQKNTILKDMNRSNYSDTTLLEVWNNELVKIGAEIILHRLEYLSIFNNFVHDRHYGISNNAENLEVSYQNEFFECGNDLNKIMERFSNLLKENMQREIEQHTSLIGPHRDDYPVLLNGKEIRKFGSQGQKRTAVLAFKLAETDTFYEYTGYYPILLLDDVLSELDDERRKYLFKNLTETQVFITGTSKDDFKDFNSIKELSVEFKEIENGKILK